MIDSTNIGANTIYEEYYKFLPIDQIDIAEMGELYNIASAGNKIEFNDFIGKNVVKLYYPANPNRSDPNVNEQVDSVDLWPQGITAPDTISISLFVEAWLSADQAAEAESIDLELEYFNGTAWINLDTWVCIAPCNQHIGPSNYSISGIEEADAESLMLRANYYRQGTTGTGKIEVRIDSGSGPSGWIFWIPTSTSPGMGKSKFVSEWDAQPYITWV